MNGTIEKLALTLIGAASEARSADQLRGVVLETLAQVAPCETAVFTPLEGNAWRFASLGMSDGDRALVTKCQASLWRYADDVQRAFDVGFRRGGYIDTELYSVSDRARLAFYREVMRKQRIVCETVVFPRWRGQPLGFIRLTRHGASPHFQRDHLAAAMQLLPTIALALRAVGADEPLTSDVLSPREAEIARYVASGLTTPEIARVLGTSPRTVRNQLSTAFQKANVSGRAELAAWMARRSQ